MASQSIVAFLSALFGLAIGSFLNVVSYRVPLGVSLLPASRCPHCGVPIRAWHNVPVLGWLALRGKAACCGAPISVRYPLVEAFTATAFVAVALAWRHEAASPAGADWVVLVAFLVFAAVSIVLALIDVDTRRLPDVIVLPSLVVAVALFSLACLLGADRGLLVRAVLAGACLYAFYAALRFVRPDAMGGGDVKLAAVVGVHLGWLGWGALIVGGFAAFVWGSIFGVLMLVMQRVRGAERMTTIAFGPWLLVGAWTGAAAGNHVAHLYGELL